MAGSGDERREEGEIVEEGEVVSAYDAAADPGSETDTDDEDARYYLQPHGPISAFSRTSSSFGSGGAISHAGAAAAAAREWFPCPVCRKEFSSSKAVHGHMRVHAQAAAKEAAEKVSVPAVVGGGGAAAGEEVADSVSVTMNMNVAVEPTTPMKSACSKINPVVDGGSGGSSARSSVEPSQIGAAAPEQEQLPVVPTTPAPPQQAAAAAFIPLMVPAALAAPRQRVSDPSAGPGFKCKECGKCFPTHQGLGGHVAGHRNRRIAEAAAAAAASGIDPQLHLACRGGAREEKLHVCKVCGAEYHSGVALGGHMRKHYSGNPIVPRKRQRVSHPKLAIGPPVQQPPPPAMDAPIAAPPAMQAPIAAPPVQVQVPAGSMRLFGVNIVKPAQNEEEQHPLVDQQ